MNVLTKILQAKRREIQERQKLFPQEQMEARASGLPGPLSLISALQQSPLPAVIAEIKKASPSAGMLSAQFHPQALAAAYERGGAAAISVLTDQPFFGGSLADLAAVRPPRQGGRGLPVLRKDFILNEYQVWEARAFGADALLLIVAALGRKRLQALLALCRQLRMDALVEVHSREELDTAVGCGARLIGINNRDLSTLAVDIAVTETLAPLLPPEITVVAESGIDSPQAAQRMLAAGAHALLIGTYLMRQQFPEQALLRFISEVARCCA